MNKGILILLVNANSSKMRCLLEICIKAEKEKVLSLILIKDVLCSVCKSIRGRKLLHTSYKVNLESGE